MKVTVIIPIKNEKYRNIKRLVDSMLLQTHKPNEIILMDSSKIYEDKRINVIHKDMDRGQARNYMVKKAKNEHIIGVDMSIYPSNYIEEIIKGFEFSNPHYR